MPASMFATEISRSMDADPGRFFRDRCDVKVPLKQAQDFVDIFEQLDDEQGGEDAEAQVD